METCGAKIQNRLLLLAENFYIRKQRSFDRKIQLRHVLVIGHSYTLKKPELCIMKNGGEIWQIQKLHS